MNCSICGYYSTKKIFTYKCEKVYFCPHCTILFSEIYKDTDSGYDQKYYSECYKPLAKQQHYASKEYWQLLNKKKASIHSVLDYGCGTGIFLKVGLDQYQLDVTGADISGYALKVACDKVNNQGTFVNIRYTPLPEKRYDVISFIDSIGHIQNLKKVMKKICEDHCSHNGLVFIRTPNITNRYKQYIRFLSIFLSQKQLCQLYFLSKRYYLFSIESLRQLFQELNLSVVHLSVKKDYSNTSKTRSMKKNIRSILYHKIPQLLGSHGSIVAIAQKRN